MPESISQNILAQIDTLAEASLTRQYEIQPELNERYTPGERMLSLNETRLSLENLAQALSLDSPVLFTDFVGWLKIRLECRGVPIKDLRIKLHCIQHILQAHFADDGTEQIGFYLEAGRNELEHTILPYQSILPRGSLGEVARQFLPAAQTVHQARTISLLEQALENGASAAEIYLQVLQPVMQEAGRLWQFNQTSAEQGQAVTTAVKAAMDRLSAIFQDTPCSELSVLVTCPNEEQHEIGARMLLDFFAQAGWQAVFLPADRVIAALREQPADVLAISVTMAVNLPGAQALIKTARAESGVKILVGGRPFNLAPNLWKKIGADGSAPDAASAVRAAEKLLGSY